MRRGKCLVLWDLILDVRFRATASEDAVICAGVRHERTALGDNENFTTNRSGPTSFTINSSKVIFIPEKGWENVNIREATKELLVKEAKAKGVSINDVVVKAV
jgi:hypothetical protein